MTIHRRGIEMRMIIDGGKAPSKADPSLLKAIVRARGWFDDLLTGKAANLTALAKRDGVSDSYICNVLPLAFLAPDIIEAIVSGHQPPNLRAEKIGIWGSHNADIHCASGQG